MISLDKICTMNRLNAVLNKIQFQFLSTDIVTSNLMREFKTYNKYCVI